ncbi:HTH-type transcriptional regulator immR [Anaerotruncus sp. 2789STDY5834896]|uniref:HTH-type transcriptional regulator immR n=1 Tax=uncultured Anaerotruncus sp. TaxID=905011 RepID=A0A1C6J9B0_9FIRM|nr:HTH-type transcriptional regulator immR [uncultured Anaerotruncus sp.]
MSLGSRIRKARKSRGLTQIELSEKSGIAVNSLRRYEADARQPQLSTLQRIAEALDVDPFGLLWADFDRTVANIADAIEGAKDSSSTSIQALAEEGIAQGEEAKRLILLDAYEKLNSEGKTTAIERVEELTEIPKYKKE